MQQLAAQIASPTAHLALFRDLGVAAIRRLLDDEELPIIPTGRREEGPPFAHAVDLD